MDFDSPDVEKEFPGLYEGKGKSSKSKEDSDYSEGEHDKLSKKDLLIGRRKDKKDKGKDRGYAALEGESSPEEELNAKSPSKSKKSKTFKFTSSKSKEKREKSRDKELNHTDAKDKDDDHKHHKHKDKDKDSKQLDKEKEKEQKKKEKERKEKDKKDKSKDKDKKDKKHKQQTMQNSSLEVFELADVQPVFGVSISLATERSRCHDGIDMPLVVRDCIDYLQEHALKSEQIYKVEPVKTRLQHFKRLYNNRERQPQQDVLDLATACGLLKLFLRELPEPILTTDLIARFEEVASMSPAQVTKQQAELQQLLKLLPNCNRTMLSWILLHFDAVIQHEKYNKLNAQSLAMLLSPPLQMSHRLLVALLCHCPNLFANVQLIKYVPPITPSSPKLPETTLDIQMELRKQESLLNQIHMEMNAGFVSKKREELLWEVQRIITQLKRKLRTLEKLSMEKSMDESSIASTTANAVANHVHVQQHSVDITDAKSAIVPHVTNKLANTQRKLSACSMDDTKMPTAILQPIPAPPTLPPPPKQSQAPVMETFDFTTLDGSNNAEGLCFDKSTGLLMLDPKDEDYETCMRLQLERLELLAWKSQLQSRIIAERAEVLRLKQHYEQLLRNQTTAVAATARTAATAATTSAAAAAAAEHADSDEDYDKMIESYLRENELLVQRRDLLAAQIFEERKQCVVLAAELAFRQLQIGKHSK